MVKQLNILDLHRCINEKQNRTNECFDKVLELCHKKIRASAQNQLMRCFIEVPCFIVGYPLFDFTKCIEYVYNRLQKNGFLIKYYFPKHLYISWDFEEINTAKKTNINTNKINTPQLQHDKRQNTKYTTMTKQSNRNVLSYKPSGKLELNLD